MDLLISKTSAAWKLVRPDGRLAKCLISARQRGWSVVLWSGRRIAVWESFLTVEAAVRRARELRAMLVDGGWAGLGLGSSTDIEFDGTVQPTSPYPAA